MSAGRHRRPRYPTRVLGRCTTVAAGAVAIAAGMSSLAAAPAAPDDPPLIARSARAAFAVPSEEYPELDTTAMTEQRASRNVVRAPVSAAPPSPDAVATAPQPQPTPPTPAPAPAPARAPAAAAPDPAARFTTSTARTGAAVESGLTANAMKVLNAVRAAYPQLSSFGGARSERGSDHSTGQAIDIMIPSYSSAAGRALGDAIAAFVQSHAAELSLDYVIWRQRIWNSAGGGWRGMSDRGGVTANHFDHVHVSVR